MSPAALSPAALSPAAFCPRRLFVPGGFLCVPVGDISRES